MAEENPQRSEAAQRFIDKSKAELERAHQLGLDRLPSPDDPYLVDAKTRALVARYGTPEYSAALEGGQAKPEPEVKPESKPKAPRMRP